MILRTFLTCFALLWSCTVFSNEITLYATEFLLPSTITPVAQKTIDTVKKAIYPKQLNIKVLQSIDEIDEVLRSKEAPIAIVGATTYLRHRKDGIRENEVAAFFVAGRLVNRHQKSSSVNTNAGKLSGIRH